MKRIKPIILTLCLTLIISMVSPIGVTRVQAQTTLNGFVFSFSGATAIVTGYTGSGGDITIPSTINNGVFDCIVTGIGDGAFSYNSRITSVKIPDTVTTIGNWAFGESYNLKGIEVDSANQYYSSVDGVLFNKSINEIIAYPAGKSGTYIIPYGVKSIGDNAFCSSKLLTDIIIPNSVLTIGISAFVQCTNLETITIPSSVTSIDSTALGGCYKLTSIQVEPSSEYYTSIDGVLYNKAVDKIIAYPGGKQGEFTIPDTVTIIGSNSFFDCDGLTSVIIPNSVKNIGSSAFYYCDQLKSVTIGNGVTSIGNGAFGECTNLTNINIPSSVTSIDAYAFSWCKSITNIDIPTSVTSIGDCAFAGCSNLTNVIIPNSVNNIGVSIFTSCSNLKSIEISNNLTTISNGMFSYCNNLSKIIIPKSIKTIDFSAFSGCTKLTEVQFLGNAPTVADRYVFSGCPVNLKFYYLCGSTGFTNPWYGHTTVKIGIEITSPPTKCDYVVGENLELNGLVVTGFYNDGTNGTIPNSMLSISGFDSSTPKKGQVVTVSINEKSATFIINIHPKTNTVTFDSKGGSLVESKTIEYDTNLTRPIIPTKTGFTFNGWYKEEACINEWDFERDKVNEDITLYAKWTVSSFNVNFDTQGGSEIDKRIVEYNTIITEPNKPTRTGYTFEGWYKEVECINGWDFERDIVTENITLYAKWTANCYNVTFNSLGGSEVIGKTAEYDTTIETPNNPTRTEYTFGGWYKEVECINKWDFERDKVTENITLYAKWTINCYNVTFNSLGGSEVIGKTAEYDTTIQAPNTPTKAGYTFSGWYKEKECINEWDFVRDKVSMDTTLYAKWESLGDLDKDGIISILDLALIAKNYNTISTDAKWNSSFDFNNDLIVDIYDLVLVSKEIGTKFEQSVSVKGIEAKVSINEAYTNNLASTDRSSSLSSVVHSLWYKGICF